eukprot:NODE_3_length_80033_cov_0.932970.p65 type:complete len:126 gc:universal NODE_3_length_80033_cov_0.932970:24869-24492(-)
MEVETSLASIFSIMEVSSVTFFKISDLTGSTNFRNSEQNCFTVNFLPNSLSNASFPKYFTPAILKDIAPEVVFLDFSSILSFFNSSASASYNCEPNFRSNMLGLENDSMTFSIVINQLHFPCVEN